MKNKVLVKLMFVELDLNYDIFLPVNELIWKIKKMIQKSVSDLTNIPLDIKKDYILINKDTGRIYTNNEILINTDIRNGSELILISKSS